nr:hypothetical protein [Tanacetum cinerariifolium]
MPIFKRTFSQDLDLVEQHLTKDILTQTDCNTTLTNIRTKFENAFNSEFKERMQKYTRFDAQSFKDEMIFNMNSIGKYMLEIILHQQRTPQLLKQKKLMQTQEDRSHLIPALNTSTLLNTLESRLNTSKIHYSNTWTQKNKTDAGKAIYVDLVVTKSSGTESEVQDDNNRSWNDTDANDADIRPIYDEEPMAERRESAFVKPDQMIASSESRNSSKNMPRFSSNDMIHNYYLEEARKKIKERNRNSNSSVMHTASPQNTTKGSKPKPKSNNKTSRSLLVSKSSCVTITAVPKVDHSKSSSSFSDSKHFFCSTCHKCVFNANHDACITKLLKEVNSRVKIQSHKTKNRNKPIDQKSHTQIPGRQIFTRHRFSPNKTSAVYEKTSPRSDLRWKLTGRIFKSVGLSPSFDEYFNGENQVVSKSSVVTTADASDKRQQQPDSTASTSTLATTVTVGGNFD